MATATVGVPRGDLAGLKQHFRADLLSGFLVFLIALPLCLGIASACGYPPIAGIFSAIIGGLLTPWISASELTIKGPAAGLIVIAIGCVQDFGGDGVPGGFSGNDLAAYRLALGVGVAAGIIQVLFGLFRTGILGEFFPTSAVHGMLAAIGVIIIAKQLPVAIGVENKGEPLELLLHIPQKFAQLNPEIAAIGGVSLLLLFGLPLIKNRYVRMVPAPMVVVLAAIPLGIWFDLAHEHTYSFYGHDYHLGEEFLVPVPDNMFSAITLPDFSGLATLKGWKWVLMFALIGSLETLLSAKAIDSLDPWKRKTNLDRDMLAVGIGNTAAALVGGLPMISEIVRSKANIDNGARTRYANLFHGLFLLFFVGLVPWLIHRIPLAALGAMLVYTGFRLASPREWVSVYKTGREQLLIFAVTIIVVLATDLLIGIAAGIAAQVLIHVGSGASFRSLFRPELVIDHRGNGSCYITLTDSAVFSSWIGLRRRLLALADANGAPREVILDLSETHLVDHTVMEKLHELQHDYDRAHCTLTITGLEGHQGVSPHPHSTRIRHPLPHRDQQVVVGLTLTDRDAGLLRYVALLAQLGIVRKAYFVHVRDEGSAAQGTAAESLAALVKAHFAAGKTEVVSAVLDGPAVDRLGEFALENSVNAIVIGKRAGASRRSFVRRLAGTAPCSLWVVPDGSPLALRTLLVPIDYSDHAADSLRLAAALTRLLDQPRCCSLNVYFNEAALRQEGPDQLTRAEHEQANQAFMARLNCRGVAIEPLFEEGPDVARAIQRVAQQQAADLIVMAPRGLSRSAVVLLGSVTEETLIETQIPMVIMRRPGRQTGVTRLLLSRFFSKKAPQFN